MLRKNHLIWAIVILPALSGCQAGGEVMGADLLNSGLVFHQPAQNEQLPPEQSPLQQPLGKQIGAPNRPPLMTGGMISAIPDDAGAFLKQIDGAEKYKLVVVIAGTDYAEDEARVFTYGGEGELAKKGIEIDTSAVSALSASGMVKNLGEIGSSSAWNGPMSGILKEKFPKARFVFVSVNNRVTAEQLNTAAYTLNTALPDDSLVLGLADYVQPENEKIRIFQADFTATVLQNFDVEKFDELPVAAPAAAKMTALYLRYKGAGKLEKYSENDFAKQVLYATGGSTEAAGPIHLVVFGDVMLGRYVRTLMDRNGNDYPFEKMDDDYLRVNDILLANLEGPIAEKAISTSKSIAFRFPPDTVYVLKKYHFDALSLANNHIFDMGQAGYDDTVKLLDEAGITNFGNPRDNGAASSEVMVVRGQRIAFLGLEEVVFDIDDDKAVEEIKRLVTEGDLVIPVVHWGVEYTHKPNDRQRDLAHKFIDAGAVAVIGHHPHVVQAYETYNGRPIFYSLGNAVFDQYWSADTQVGLSVAMTIDKEKTEIIFIPHKIVMSQLQFMDEKETAKFLEEFAGYGEGDDTEKEALASGHLILPQ